MSKASRKWSDVKAELIADSEFREEWLATRTFRQVASEVVRVRSEKNLTQQELAALIGTTKSTISRIESLNYGRVTITTLDKIARALGMELEVRFKEAG